MCVFSSRFREKCLRFHIVDGRFPKSFCLLMKRNIDFYHSFLICISSFCGDILVFKVFLCQMYIQLQKWRYFQNEVGKKHAKNELLTAVFLKVLHIAFNINFCVS